MRDARLGRFAGIAFAVISAGVIAFQLALALGAPWGSFAMGGAYPGRFPPALRGAAVVQAVLIGLMAAVVVSRAGVALPSWSRASRWLVWVVVAYGVVGFVLNTITPSIVERLTWAPTTFLMLLCSSTVAISALRAERSSKPYA